MPGSWLHSSTSASQPESVCSTYGVGLPMSVSTPTRCAPSPTTNCTGSRASCGTGNGCTHRSPTVNVSWLSNAKTSSDAKRSPITCSVPNVAQTGIWCFAENAATPPAWSACSCVTRRAVMVSGSTPRRRTRVAASRAPKPQSMRTRVAPASTRRPLPSLPLPIEANLTAAATSLQLFLQQGEDLLAVLRLLRRARRVLHADDAVRRDLRDLDAVLLRLVLLVGLPEHQLREPALLAVLARHVALGIGVAHVVEAAG